jgi:hypothetical protein
MKAFKEAGVYDQCIKAAVRPDPNDPGAYVLVLELSVTYSNRKEMFMTMRIADQRPEGFDFGKWRFEGVSFASECARYIHPFSRWPTPVSSSNTP